MRVAYRPLELHEEPLQVLPRAEALRARAREVHDVADVPVCEYSRARTPKYLKYLSLVPERRNDRTARSVGREWAGRGTREYSTAQPDR